MAIVLTNKLVFLEHPRTGSTAVRRAIRAIGGQTRARHALVAPTGREKTVSTIRDPYDLLISWWLVIKDRTGSWSSLAEFVSSYNNMNMVRNGRLFYFRTDYTMRYLRLQEDLNKVLRTVHIRPVRLEHVNITPDKQPFMSYHTTETIEIINTRFAQDVEEYSHDRLV